jgi:hypothetical protein
VTRLRNESTTCKFDVHDVTITIPHVAHVRTRANSKENERLYGSLGYLTHLSAAVTAFTRLRIRRTQGKANRPFLREALRSADTG